MLEKKMIQIKYIPEWLGKKRQRFNLDELIVASENLDIYLTRLENEQPKEK